MKKSLCILFLSLICYGSLYAQKNTLGVGTGIGILPYVRENSQSFELQYIRQLFNKTEFYVALGTISGAIDETITISFQQNTTRVVTVQVNDQFRFLDLGLNQRLLTDQNLYSAFLSLGYGWGYSVFSHPRSIVVNQFEILEQIDETARTWIDYLSLRLITTIHLSKRINLHYGFAAKLFSRPLENQKIDIIRSGQIRTGRIYSSENSFFSHFLVSYRF